MKNILFITLIFALFFNCGDDPFAKVKTENVVEASARDNSPLKYPVMTFDKKFTILDLLMMVPL